MGYELLNKRQFTNSRQNVPYRKPFLAPMTPGRNESGRALQEVPTAGGDYIVVHSRASAPNAEAH